MKDRKILLNTKKEMKNETVMKALAKTKSSAASEKYFDAFAMSSLFHFSISPRVEYIANFSLSSSFSSSTVREFQISRIPMLLYFRIFKVPIHKKRVDNSSAIPIPARSGFILFQTLIVIPITAPVAPSRTEAFVSISLLSSRHSENLRQASSSKTSSELMNYFHLSNLLNNYCIVGSQLSGISGLFQNFIYF